MITRRLGRIYVSMDVFFTEDSKFLEPLQRIFAKLLVLDIRHDLSTRKSEYVAMSLDETFDVVPEGAAIPEYGVIFNSTTGEHKFIKQELVQP